MIFGTQVGVAPGTLTMALGNVPGQLTYTQNGPVAPCPPDPVWQYFPNPFEPYTYFRPPSEQAPPAQPTVVQPICVWPPNMTPPDKPPSTTQQPPPILQPAPEPAPPVVVYPPSNAPSNTPTIGPRMAVMNPYANEVRLSGLRGLGEVGPFGLTWGGFIGVMAIALGGGIGLGWLSKRRR